MFKYSFWKLAVCALAAAGTVLPAQLVEASNQTPLRIERTNSAILDLQLSETGTFTGRVVDHSGTPVAETTVVIRQGQTEVAKTKTNEAGVFSVAGLKGGVYEVASGKAVGVYRLWTQATAPDKAADTALLVLGENGSRGAFGALGPGMLLLGGALIGTLAVGIVNTAQTNDLKSEIKALQEQINNLPTSP